MTLTSVRAVLALALTLAACTASADEPTTKPAAPTPAALRKATTQVDQLYREEVIKARDPQAKAALARKILDAARDEQNPEVKYALLNKSITSAIAAGDASTASEAVDRIDESWNIDAAKLRAETLVKTSRSLHTPEDQSAFVQLVGPMVEKMIADKKFDPAKSLNDAAVSAAQKSTDPSQAKSVSARSAEIVERRTAESRVTLALNTLKTKPDDPTANAAVGKYECYIEDKWTEGLAKLAKGNDPSLKALAAKELPEDAPADAKVAAADGWWDLARREGELAKRHIQQHAATLYRSALPSLNGIAKQKVDKRLSELADASTPPVPIPLTPTPAQSTAQSDTPKVMVANLSRAAEAQPIIDAVAHDFPDALKGITQATLLYYRDASQLSHGQGGSQPLRGSFSTSPSISKAPTFLYYGLADPFKPGRYLVVYRVQVLKPNPSPTAFQTDVYFQGDSLGRRFVKASDVPVGEWKAVGMSFTLNMPLKGEYRIYAGKDATLALDRVYVFAVQ